MISSRIFKWIVAAIGAALVIASMYPPTRQKVQNWISPEQEREILASAEGDLLNNGKNVKVLKYKGTEGIFVEVLDLDGGNSDLVARITFPDKHDGLFNLHGRVTRLAIADIDNDGTNELLVPTFDDQLVPHLNIYRYNPELKRFEPVRPP